MNDFLLSKYQNLLGEFEQKFRKTLAVKDENQIVRSALFAANMTNFMPHVPMPEHEAMFEDLQVNAALENFDWKITNVCELTDLQGNTDVLAEVTQPKIFCSFHLGSYRLLARHLARSGYNFSIIVRKGIHSTLTDDFMDTFEDIKATTKRDTDFRVHDAESPDVLLKIVRELKEGRSLMLYLDGNTGTGRDKMDEISFLGKQMLVKKGLGYMSYLADVPVVPVVAYRKPNLQNVIYFGDTILPNKSLSREEYSQKTIQKVFDFLGQHVKKYPQQWEAWNYVHNFLKPVEDEVLEMVSEPKNQTIFSFNHLRYSLLNLSESSVLFDKIYYNTFEITKDLLEYLSGQTLYNPKKELGNPVFNELVLRQVLV